MVLFEVLRIAKYSRQLFVALSPPTFRPVVDNSIHLNCFRNSKERLDTVLVTGESGWKMTLAVEVGYKLQSLAFDRDANQPRCSGVKALVSCSRTAYKECIGGSELRS